ncbi:MAG: TPM domain-containing protein [Bdellovibrionales bacterium]|nr:TPM domain-containing protein [Bdellovibrionales bacterium]
MILTFARADSLRSLISIVFFLLSIFGSELARADFVVPQLTGPVVDQAKVLSDDVARELEFTIRRLQESGGPQFTVVIVESLSGMPVESAAIKIADAWKLGDQKRDDGVILLVSMNDRKIRIEVGQGLEGILTDLDSKRIIEEQMVPAFRTGQASYGVLLGSRAIMAKIAPQQVKSEFAALPVRTPNRSRELPLPLLLVLIVISVIGSRLQKRGRYRRFRGYDPSRSAGGWTSGGGGWSGGSSGGSSGGGWSGGGGGFSGGGASGGW